MPLNKTKLPHTDMTPAQFQDWPHPIVNEALFPDSDIASYWRCLLAQNADALDWENVSPE